MSSSDVVNGVAINCKPGSYVLKVIARCQVAGVHFGPGGTIPSANKRQRDYLVAQGAVEDVTPVVDDVMQEEVKEEAPAAPERVAPRIGRTVARTGKKKH